MVTSKRVPVGAHYGWRDWLAQRVTAVVMALYTLLILGILLWYGGLDYTVWLAVFRFEPFRIATFIFMVALLWHAWVGVRNIAMDYVKPIAVRLALQSSIVAALIAYLGWTIGILWG